MNALLQRIERFAVGLAGDFPSSPQGIVDAWHTSNVLKAELLARMATDPGNDDLLLARQRLGSPRGELKTALIRAFEEPGAEGASDPMPGAIWSNLAEEALRHPAVGQTAEDASLQERMASLLVGLEQIMVLRVGAPVETLEEEPFRRLGGVAHELRGSLLPLLEEQRESGLSLLRVWLDDIGDRMKQAESPRLVWADMLDAMTAEATITDWRGRSGGSLPGVRARIEWLWREAQDRQEFVPVLRASKRLILRRLETYSAEAEKRLAVVELPGDFEDDAFDAALGSLWNWLQAGTALSAETEELALVLEREGLGASYEKLREAAADQCEVMERMRQTLRGHVSRIPPDELERWRLEMVERSDEVLSQVPARGLGWACGALGDARFDAKWIQKEYEERLKERGENLPEGPVAEGSGPDSPDLERSAPATSENAMPTGVQHGGLETLKKMRSDVVNEHRERLLQARLERLLTRPGARALDAVVNILIVVILTLLFFQLVATLRSRHLPDPAAPGTVAVRVMPTGWTREEILHPYLRWMEEVDAIICLVFLFEFFLKISLAEDRRWYFRRRWFTDLLPSIPFGYLLNVAAANYVTALRGIRLLRLLRAVRFVRILSLSQRVADRLVRKFRGLLDVRVVAFSEPDSSRNESVTPERTLTYRAGRIVSQALSQVQHMLDEAPTERGRFWRQEAALVSADIGALSPAELNDGRLGRERRQREIRLEALIERMKQIDVLQIEAALGSASVRQIGRYLRIGAPIYGRILGLRRPLASLPPGEVIADVCVALGNRMESFLENVVNYVRDLYGIVSVPEFLSFVGGFFARVFRRQRNRLFIGIVIIAVSVLMIQVARQFDEFVVHARVPVPRGSDPEMMAWWIEDEIRSHRGVAMDLEEIRGDDGATTISATLHVPQIAFGFSSDRARRVIESNLKTRLQARGVEIEQSDVEVDRAALGQVGRALRNSFGAVLLIVGAVGFLLVWFGNWLMNRAGQVVDEHLRVSEAAFINLMKDHKRRHLSRDMEILARRVLRPELPVRVVLEENADDRLAGQLRERLQRIASPTDDFPAPADGAGEDKLLLDRILLLYRDYMDGAVLHKSDIKTTEQLLGNLTVQEVMRRVGLSDRDRSRLNKLDLSKGRSLFGPYIWFTFITNSICQKVGRLVMDFNERYDTTEFTVLHILSLDPEREAGLERKFGPRVLAELRHERRQLMRSVFGTFPMQPRAVNLFAWYREHYEGGVRIFKLPLHALWALLWGLAWGPRRFVRMLRDFVNPEAAAPPPSPRAGVEVAHRKINRMRRPVFMAALRLRASIDLAYLDISVPHSDLAGCEGNTVNDDLELIAATPGERAEVARLREDMVQRVRRLGQVLRSLGLLGPAAQDPSPEEVRAWFTEFALDEDLSALLDAHDFFAHELDEIVERDGWPEGRRLRHLITWSVYAARRRLASSRSRREAPPRRLAEARFGPEPSAKTLRALDRAYYFDVKGARRYMDLCSRRDALENPRERVVDALLRAARRAERLRVQLVVMRTVQTLAVLDLTNYRDIVSMLGEFETG